MVVRNTPDAPSAHSLRAAPPLHLVLCVGLALVAILSPLLHSICVPPGTSTSSPCAHVLLDCPIALVPPTNPSATKPAFLWDTCGF
jgi:hypothetical protein